MSLKHITIYAATGMVLLLCGCDFQQDDVNIIPEEAAPPPTFNLKQGQSEKDVRTLLGTPSGIISITNKIVLLYNGELLEFIDGKLSKDFNDIRSHVPLAPPPQEKKPPETFLEKVAYKFDEIKKKLSQQLANCPGPFRKKG